MDIFQQYIDQQKDQYSECLDRPGNLISIFVVIPCYNEPDIFATLNSLADCTPPGRAVAVIIVINDAINSPQNAVIQNISTIEGILKWQFQRPKLFFHVQRIYAHALPQKWAGVGWARKIGMDEAIKQIVNNNSFDGIIVSLDADSTVSPNYLQMIEKAFEESPASNFFTIHFEHPFEDQCLSSMNREGIIRYELYLRYYRNALQWSGYPHAIHTVGSSFALKASAYVKQGGMNRRKAGEDFYFLHKLLLLDNYGKINTTNVFPASRLSERVPFGTGAAVKKWMEGNPELHFTYSLKAFDHLKTFFTSASRLWSIGKSETEELFTHLNPSLQSFCQSSQSVRQLIELRKNCSTEKVFCKRFFHLFNAFWILKYLNFVHATALKRADLKTECLKLLLRIGIQADRETSPEHLLQIFRDLDKKD